MLSAVVYSVFVNVFFGVEAKRGGKFYWWVKKKKKIPFFVFLLVFQLLEPQQMRDGSPYFFFFSPIFISGIFFPRSNAEPFNFLFFFFGDLLEKCS